MPRLAPVRCLPFAAGLIFSSSAAFAANVTLDNLHYPQKDGTETVIPHVEVTDTNLTQAEVQKLFSTGTSKDEASAILRKMNAAKVSLPQVQVVSKGGLLTVRDVQATKIAAGKVDHFGLAGIDGGVNNTDGTVVTINSKAMALDGWDFSNVIDAIQTGDPSGLGQVSHMSWAGFDATMSDKTTPKTAPGGNLYQVSLGSFDASSNYNGTVPTTGKMELKGLIITPPKASDFGKNLTQFGYDRLELGMTAGGTYDGTAKTYALSDLTIVAAKAGTLTLKGDFGGIEPGVFNGDKNQRAQAAIGSSVSDVTLRYTDAGVFDKVLAYIGKTQKKTADALRKEWSGMATQMVPMLLGGDPSSLKLAGALGTFINKPGTLTITLKAKSGAVKVMDLAGIRSPADALALIDVDAQAN